MAIHIYYALNNLIVLENKKILADYFNSYLGIN